MLSGPRKVQKWIGWSPPMWPWCKLNSDGACKQTGASSADYLANYAISLPLDVHIFSNPPLGVNAIIMHDLYGISYPRLALP